MQQRFHKYVIAIKVLTIVGLVVSAPFILFVGLGFAAFAPLLGFFFVNRRFERSVNNNSALSSSDYKAYIMLALLSGAGSAFGFYMLWQLSHGVDVEETPFAPFIVMASAGGPLIKAWIIM